MSPNFLLVDDHYAVRKGVRLILSQGFPAANFDEAASAQEAMAKLYASSWDVVILDIGLPGRSGLDVLKEIKQNWPKTATVVLTMHAEDQFAVRALKLGASSYLSKEGIQDELVRAIEAVLRGGKYLTPQLAERLAFQVGSERPENGHDALSDREYQILCMIALGKTIKEIGADLSLSPKTVSTYRARILRKLQVSNNSQIMRYAVARGLVKLQGEAALARAE